MSSRATPILKTLAVATPLILIAASLLLLEYGGKNTSFPHPETAKTAPPPPIPENPYAYDPQASFQVPEKMVGYEEIAPIPISIPAPSAMAADAEGNALVAGDNVLARYSPSGAETARWKTRGVPLAISISQDGKIALAFENRCEVRSRNGSLEKTVSPLPEGTIPTSLALDGSNLYLADAGNHIVDHFSLPDGKKLADIAPPDGKFIIPSPYFDVAISPDGSLWAANTGRHRLDSFSIDGTYRVSWSKPAAGVEGFSGCCNPSHFAFMPNGSFVTAEKNIPRVKIYDPSGRFATVVAPPKAFPEKAMIIDVAFDPQHALILILESKTNAIRRFRKKAIPPIPSSH